MIGPNVNRRIIFNGEFVTDGEKKKMNFKQIPFAKDFISAT